MIINKDIHPERKIYYLGALVLDAIKQSSGKEIDFFDTYQKVNDRSKIKISIMLFTLALDWLYLLGLITNNQGRIEKCF